jgi:hypothetical protein
VAYHKSDLFIFSILYRDRIDRTLSGRPFKMWISPRRCNQPVMVENVMINESSMIKLESKEFFCHKDWIFQSFGRFFESSILTCFDSSLNFIDIYNLDFLIFLMNDILHPKVYFVFLSNRNRRINCNFFSFGIFEMKAFRVY